MLELFYPGTSFGLFCHPALGDDSGSPNCSICRCFCAGVSDLFLSNEQNEVIPLTIAHECLDLNPEHTVQLLACLVFEFDGRAGAPYIPWKTNLWAIATVLHLQLSIFSHG